MEESFDDYVASLHSHNWPNFQTYHRDLPRHEWILYHAATMNINQIADCISTATGENHLKVMSLVDDLIAATAFRWISEGVPSDKVLPIFPCSVSSYTRQQGIAKQKAMNDYNDTENNIDNIVSSAKRLRQIHMTHPLRRSETEWKAVIESLRGFINELE